MMLTKVQQRKVESGGRSKERPAGRRVPDERWVVRCWLPDGSATDVIGWIEALDATSVRLSSSDQQLHVIERSKIIAARRVPAAAGGPDPRRISAADLQRHALLGWLGWHEPLGEWTLRAAGGFTRRANSCHAVGDPGIPIRQAADQIIGFAVTHDIAPMAQVIEESSEEQALRDVGWASSDQPTAVLVTRLADFLAARPADVAVEITQTLEPGWEEAISAQPAELRRSEDRPDDLGRQPAPGLCGRCRGRSG